MSAFRSLMGSAALAALMLVSMSAQAFDLFSPINRPKPLPNAGSRYFYSLSGREHLVSFDGVYRTDYTRLSDVEALSDDAREDLRTGDLYQTMAYLFGPLVNRELASPSTKGTVLTIDWSRAAMNSGHVEVPYHYQSTWLLDESVALDGSLDVPVPVSRKATFSARWKNCSDSEPDHQTPSFYWYFWDPSRPGCDQREGNQYRTVHVTVGQETVNTTATYPEYNRLVENGQMSMTLAFGYVQDPATPNPETDLETGAEAYRDFLSQFRMSWGTRLHEQPILQGEYKSSTSPNTVIGHRFTGTLNGAQVTVNVVMAAGIDQMEIFAKSFAHDHDGVFGWFGHSRVGSGFDAERFGEMVQDDPSFYSISDRYQVIYWGGCNSYSYYVQPFFKFKGGTKNLDIVANGLPSFFSLNAGNAMIAANAFLNWPARTSYQQIVDAIEGAAENAGTKVLATVLGDEDNP